ncbi:MAG: hypothetical protein ACJ8FS_00585 [Sphingomicrobium sp.]
MHMFEYVVVLAAIVIGLALTHLMQGIAGVIQHPERPRVWWVHLVWVAYMFVSVVFWWWWEFRLQLIEQWTFSIYSFVIFYAFYLYLICAMLFPKDLEGYQGYKDYFLARRGWFFGLLLGWSAIDIIDSWIKGPKYLASLGVEGFISSGILAIACVVGIVTRRGTIQAAIALALLIYQLSGALRNFYTVS